MNLENQEVIGNMTLSDIISNALAEDVGIQDITSNATISEQQAGTARIISKQSGVIAGTEVAEQVFTQVDAQLIIKNDRPDGVLVQPGETIIVIEGTMHSILRAERVALNFLAHLSGVATLTAQYVNEVADTSAKITDTRKTMPLMRTLEKQAVVAGGGVNHRMGLFDMILIKENHVTAAGGIRKAVSLARRYQQAQGISVAVEVETRNLDEVHEVLTTDAQRIMLDNMTIEEIKEAIALINHQMEVEVSGGVTLENVREIALCGPDYISVGAITHSVKAFDFSLLLDE